MVGALFPFVSIHFTRKTQPNQFKFLEKKFNLFPSTIQLLKLACTASRIVRERIIDTSFHTLTENIKPDFIAVQILRQQEFNCGQLARLIHLMPFGLIENTRLYLAYFLNMLKKCAEKNPE